MRHFIIGSTVCLFFCSNLFGSFSNHPEANVAYFSPSEVMIRERAIYVLVDENWMQTDVIHTDEQGFYLFGYEIENTGSRVQKDLTYKCPYCFRPIALGEKCEADDCPKVLWKKKKRENE